MFQSDLADKFLLEIYNSIKYTDDAVDVYAIAEKIDITTSTLERIINHLKFQGFIAKSGWDDVNLLDKGARYAEHLIRTEKVNKNIFG